MFEPKTALDACRSSFIAAGIEFDVLRLAPTTAAFFDFYRDEPAMGCDPAADAAAAENPIAGDKGWAAFGAFDTSERTRMLDKYGFVSQLVFTTASLAALKKAESEEEKVDILEPWNS